MSKNLDKNLIENLKELGLTDKEAVVYIDLLSRPKPVGSSKIVHRTKLHGQYVYDALYALEEKGLAKHSIVNNRKKFEANAPFRIKSLIEEKKRIADSTIKMLEPVMKKNPGQEFEVFSGETSFSQQQFAAMENMPDGGEILIISTNWVDLFTKSKPEFYYQYEKKRKEKQISIRFVLSEGMRERAEASRKERYANDARFLPDYQSHGGICIFNDHVDFELLGDPITIFSFKNKKIADGYRIFFDVLWKLGKE